jgi:MoaA/NifB/PqqE/SkfB family radical SAM enzyme
MHVVLNLLFECNLKCEYCYLQAKDTRYIIHKHKSEYRPIGDWIDGLKWLGSQFTPITNVDLSGGEPFLYPHLIELISKIPIDIYLGLTTNATNIPENLKYLSEERKQRMHITASLHLDSEGNIPLTFLSNVTKLRDWGFNFCVNFVSYEKQADKIWHIRKLFESMKIELHIEPYIDYNNPEKKLGNMSDLVYSELDKETKKMLTKIKNRKIPSYCYIGMNYVWITPDGNIYQCMGQLFNKHDPLGNIFEKRLDKLTDYPYMCDIFCPCAQNW